MVEGEKKYASIGVFEDTKSRLDKIVTKDLTYDEFINKLLDLYEKKKGASP